MTKTPQRNLLDYISKISEHAYVRAGSPMPVGAHESNDGVNFALFSRNATRVRLEFFNHPEDAAPARTIDLDSARNRTGDDWHLWVTHDEFARKVIEKLDVDYELLRTIPQ